MKWLDTFLANLQLRGFQAPAQRAEFYQQLAKAIRQREHIRDFVDAELSIAAAPATKNASRAHALRLIRAQLSRSDVRLSVALGRVMPASDRLLLAAVDDANDRAQVLDFIAESVRGQAKLKALVKRKLLPPLMVIPGIGAMCYVIANKTIPVIVQTAPPEMWTGFSLFVRQLAEFLSTWGAPLVVAVALGAVALSFAMPRWTGKWRAKAETVRESTALLLFPVCPVLLPLSVYRDLQAGMTFAALSVLLEGGATLKDALLAVAKAGSPWLRWRVLAIVRHLETNPSDFQRAFAKGLVSPQLLARLSSDIRTTRRFDEVLIKLGREGLVEVEQRVDKQTGVINFLLLVSSGVLMLTLFMGSNYLTFSLQEQFTPAAIAKRQAKQRQMRQLQSPAPVGQEVMRP